MCFRSFRHLLNRTIKKCKPQIFKCVHIVIVLISLWIPIICRVIVHKIKLLLLGFSRKKTEDTMANNGRFKSKQSGLERQFGVDWRCRDLMACSLASRSSRPGSSLGHGHCILFLGKTICSQCLSLGVTIRSTSILTTVGYKYSRNSDVR